MVNNESFCKNIIWLIYWLVIFNKLKNNTIKNSYNILNVIKNLLLLAIVIFIIIKLRIIEAI